MSARQSTSLPDWRPHASTCCLLRCARLLAVARVPTCGQDWRARAVCGHDSELQSSGSTPEQQAWAESAMQAAPGNCHSYNAKQ